MDLESELRKAMAEQVAGAAAPPSLAADVRRRHRRRVARIRTTMGAAGASVVAIALVPAYQTFRAAPAGAPENAAPSNSVSMYRQPEPPPAPEVPVSPPAGRPGAGRSHGAAGGTPPGAPGGHPSKPGVPGLPKPPGWVTYLPGGLTAHAPCAMKGGAERRTTVCEWRGTGGWVEITLVRGTGFGLGDLPPVRGVPGRASVRGTPAIIGDGPGSGRQIAWLARPGVGAVVRAGGGAEDRLMRIAEGVRP
ncbi:hypothetical protein AGRA3207_004834 [Actinomadura graeca]|uniref:Uncharacterized protein n=1 Tax=Actinomadura graeca TaxID=2750812 RepID=A0ABX8R062_9ACTN|nr:hypothetical protein [Actinomadura graeca]QXJ23649.1 hypothetical protein AGRA3207_004834 [Actinomadura graeca]